MQSEILVLAARALKDVLPTLELTADDLREIESAASKITIRGARYPEAMERMSNR